MRHDSEIRSDWIQIGGGRKTMESFAMELRTRLALDSSDEHAHDGRNDSSSCDRISVTSPGGWGIAHEGSATVKVRGCTFYRQAARRAAFAIAQERGLRWGARSRDEILERKAR